MSARWYAPATGTFTSSDTPRRHARTRPPSAGTPYGYADGNPLTNTDPTGHWGCVWTGLFSVCLPQAPGLNEGSTGGWSGQSGTQSYCGLFCKYVAQSNTGSQYGYQGNWNQWSFFGSFTAEMLAREAAASRPAGGSSSGGWCDDCGGGGWSPGWCSWGCPAPPPPPPPPPPQDCYAGPDPSCSPPVPPSWLRTIPYQSQPTPRDVTNWREISTKDRIREQPPTEQQILNQLHLETAGTTAGANENGGLASGQNSGTNASLPNNALSTIAQPVAPPVIIDPIPEPIVPDDIIDRIPQPVVPDDIIDRVPEPVVPDDIIDPIVPRLPERLINVGGLQGPQIYKDAAGGEGSSGGEYIDLGPWGFIKRSVMTYQTYTKVNPQTGQVYAGKTSGLGSPLENVARRDSGHVYSKRGFGPAQLDQSSTNKDAISGREQMLIDYYVSLGRSGNVDKNPVVTNREDFIQQAINEFGPISESEGQLP